ncbi:MAG: MlaD family protein [Planctomycetota bacterium]|jgi:ABC-type transporter Mla subunit MlaD
MARKTRNEVAVGATTLVVLVLAIYIVVTLADWSSIFTAQQKITVRVPYRVGLKGLSNGSPVLLGGVKIGQITRTEICKLSPTKPGTDDIYVFFTMKIPQQYQLRRDCVLVPESNVLGGQALLSIKDLGREGEIIKDGQTMDLTLPDSMMETIKREFDSSDANSILALVKYEINRDNPDSLVASLKNVAAQLEKGIPAITSQIEQTLTKGSSALETAQSTLKNLQRLTGDERVDRIINNIAEVSVNLKLTSQEVRRAPWKLLYKPKGKEVRIQAVVDSAGAFATGAERLDSAALRLQKLLATTEDTLLVDKDQIKSMVSELEASFEQFQKAEQKFWEELK